MVITVITTSIYKKKSEYEVFIMKYIINVINCYTNVRVCYIFLGWRQCVDAFTGQEEGWSMQQKSTKFWVT